MISVSKAIQTREFRAIFEEDDLETFTRKALAYEPPIPIVSNPAVSAGGSSSSTAPPHIANTTTPNTNTTPSTLDHRIQDSVHLLTLVLNEANDRLNAARSCMLGANCGEVEESAEVLTQKSKNGGNNKKKGSKKSSDDEDRPKKLVVTKNNEPSKKDNDLDLAEVETQLSFDTADCDLINELYHLLYEQQKRLEVWKSLTLTREESSAATYYDAWPKLRNLSWNEMAGYLVRRGECEVLLDFDSLRKHATLPVLQKQLPPVARVARFGRLLVALARGQQKSYDSKEEKIEVTRELARFAISQALAAVGCCLFSIAREWLCFGAAFAIHEKEATLAAALSKGLLSSPGRNSQNSDEDGGWGWSDDEEEMTVKERNEKEMEKEEEEIRVLVNPETSELARQKFPDMRNRITKLDDKSLQLSILVSARLHELIGNYRSYFQSALDVPALLAGRTAGGIVANVSSDKSGNNNNNSITKNAICSFSEFCALPEKERVFAALSAAAERAGAGPELVAKFFGVHVDNSSNMGELHDENDFDGFENEEDEDDAFGDSSPVNKSLEAAGITGEASEAAVVGRSNMAKKPRPQLF